MQDLIDKLRAHGIDDDAIKATLERLLGEPPGEVDGLIAELRALGADEDALAELLDAAIDWRVVVPGPGGVVLEAIDGPAWRLYFRGMGSVWRTLKAWHKDPERREKARARRAARKARRQARRK